MEHAIGIADVALGPDPEAPAETLYFTGPVKVKKWPLKGYTRTVLPDGRVQITAEIVDRDKGMLLARSATSFMVKAPVKITVAPGHPDEEEPAPAGVQVSSFRQRSVGRITQLQPGIDFPAKVEMSLFLNFHTPLGVLHNEDPIVLESVIDGIPPVKVDTTAEGHNEWRATNMPIRFLDEEGRTRAWMTTRAHRACLVHPDTITQLQVEGAVTVTIGGKEEKLQLKGISEIHQYRKGDGSRLEMVQLYLDGESGALGGQVALTSPNNGCRRVPIGEVTREGQAWFDVPLVFKTGSGLVRTGDSLRIASSRGAFPALGAMLHGGSDHPLLDERGRRIGNLDTIDLKILGPFEHPPVRGVRFTR